jgi:hypothetical protein
MEMNGRIHAPAALPSGTRRIGSRVGPRASIDDSAPIAPCKEVFKDLQKKMTLSKIMSCFIKSSVSLSAMHSNSIDHPDNFQTGTATSFQ